jgi:hypothetical protein
MDGFGWFCSGPPRSAGEKSGRSFRRWQRADRPLLAIEMSKRTFRLQSVVAVLDPEATFEGLPAQAAGIQPNRAGRRPLDTT